MIWERGCDPNHIDFLFLVRWRLLVCTTGLGGYIIIKISSIFTLYSGGTFSEGKQNENKDNIAYDIDVSEKDFTLMVILYVNIHVESKHNIAN